MNFTELSRKYKSLDLILSEDPEHGRKYLLFGNSDGKMWLLPADVLRTALCIYQPSSQKGRLLKSLLPALMKLAPSMALSKTGGEILSLRHTERFDALLSETFDGNIPDTAIFLGTPGVHTKLTLQFFKGQEIFAYGKLSYSGEAIKLTKHEEEVLESLRLAGYERMPRVLFGGTPFDESNARLLIQSTTKTPSSGVAHSLKVEHYQAVVELMGLTGRTCAFSETTYCKDLLRLRAALAERILHERNLSVLLTDAIDAVISRESNYESVTYVRCHGDFTPWNTYLAGGRLELFDWEYSKEEYPPYYDIFHFTISHCYYEKHMTAAEISSFLKNKLLPEMSLLTEEADFLLLEYLLGILALYESRCPREVRLLDSHPVVQIFSDILKDLKGSI